MRKRRWRALFIILVLTAVINTADAQCSICTKTAGQLGEKTARGLNTGIVYLMLAPFTIVGYIGFRWWRAEKLHNSEVE